MRQIGDADVQVDLVNWNQDERFGAYGGAHAMVLGGYSQLTDAMAALLEDLHYSAPVAEVACREGGAVSVSTRDGRRFDADAAIVAVPAGVLHAGSIRFSPELPGWKRQALSQIGMGKLNKVRTWPLATTPRIIAVPA